MSTKVRLILVAIAVIAATVFLYGQKDELSDIRILISPYQDLAMLVNIKPLKLEEKYNTSVDIKTIPWEETYTTILSAIDGADMAFASLADFMIKAENLNKDTKDPLKFIYPAYIFKGGAFVTFKRDIPAITRESLKSSKALQDFLALELGLPKNTLYQMILFYLADLADIPFSKIKYTDVSFDTGLLGAQAKHLDATAVGLTQLTEAKKQGGKVVLDMNTLGFADITGFIVKQSTLDTKGDHIRNVIKMWFDSVNHVMSDIDQNSADSLAYLEKNAATKYALETYKAALSQEYFPKSLGELQREILSDQGKYPASRIKSVIGGYLKSQQIIREMTDEIIFINL